MRFRLNTGGFGRRSIPGGIGPSVTMLDMEARDGIELTALTCWREVDGNRP